MPFFNELALNATAAWPMRLFATGGFALQNDRWLQPLELARLWQAEGVERPLSKFLAASASLRWLRKLDPDAACVFSYADPRSRLHSKSTAR